MGRFAGIETALQPREGVSLSEETSNEFEQRRAATLTAQGTQGWDSPE
jgi:hypothetical protein